jgi:multidrug resistance efflux pump
MKQIIALIVLLVVAGGLVFYSQWRPKAQTISGFVEAHDVRIGSRVGGRVKDVLASEGAKVGYEQELLKLEPFDLEERLAEAKAEAEARESELNRMTHGFRPEEIAEAQARRDQLAARLARLQAGPRPQEVAIARDRLKSAEAQRAQTAPLLKRKKDLFDRGQITATEWEEAMQKDIDAAALVAIRTQELSLALEGTRKEEIEEAKAQLAEAEAVLTLRKSGFRAEDIEAAKAAAAAAQAALRMIDEQYKELTIIAPRQDAGVATKKDEAPFVVEAFDLRPGDLVTANAPVLSLRDKSSKWIRAYVPESDLKLAPLGRKVQVTIDTFPGKTFEGEITFVSPQAEFTPRNVQTIEERSKQVFRIKVTLKDPDDQLRSGMIGDVWLGK